MSTTAERTARDPHFFRTTLGHFPTGVVAITSMDENGEPTGMAVGSFTSVSLDPPLVAFLPDKSSSTFPKVRANGRFCVNVLGSHQQAVCRSMSRKGGDKFADVAWTPTELGSPRVHDSVAWIDCSISAIHDAGDHYIVVGEVHDLDIGEAGAPLVFFQGGYGRFASTSLTAPAELDLYRPLAALGDARSEMITLATELGAECCASAVVGNQLVLVGSVVGTGVDRRPRIRLGSRMPFVAPLGLGWAAWLDVAARQRWAGSVTNRIAIQDLTAALDRVRARGWSVVLHSSGQARLERAVSAADVTSPSAESVDELTAATADLDLAGYEPAELARDKQYDVRVLSAPVFDAQGELVLLLSLYRAPRGLSGPEVEDMGRRLAETASAVTGATGGRPPA